MLDDPHFAALERMYLAAPINAFYRPTLDVAEGEAAVEIEVTESLFHSAGGVHGSVYFKMLDDAAFFAAASLEREVFVLTASFTTYLTRPVTSGRLRSVGRVVHRGRTQFIAEAVLHDEKGKEVGRGNGIFVRGPGRLRDALGYAADVNAQQER
jgi:uncharacterized protein (TIGR00369 family)